MAKGEEAKRAEAKKKCFVISPLGDAGTDIRRKADDFLKYIVEQCPAIQDYDVHRADKIGEPGRITSQIMRAIVEADIVVADVTGANPNVYYEMALCHGIGKPIIVCAEDGTTLPFDTRDNRTVFYHLHSRRAEEARQELAGQIAAINKDGFKPDNPIADANAIIELRRTGKADQAAILERLDEISSRIGTIENQQRSVVSAPNFVGGGISGLGGLIGSKAGYATPSTRDYLVELLEQQARDSAATALGIVPSGKLQFGALAAAGRAAAKSDTDK